MVEKPSKQAKRWVPDLLFDGPQAPAPKPATPRPSKTMSALFPEFQADPPPTPPAQAGEESGPESVAAEEPTFAPPLAAPAPPPPPQPEAAPAEPVKIGDLYRNYEATDLALRKLRVKQRDLQDAVAKAKHTVM